MRDSDSELLRRGAAGDEPAFAELYDRHHAGVHRFAWFLGGSAAVAEEVTQEVFLALIREPGQFDPARGGLAAFLCGIARNLVRKHLARDRRLVPIEDENDWAVEADAAGELAGVERIESLRQAVMALPLRYREAVTLCHIEGLSYREAAAILECSEGTICSRLSRARALLTKKLAKQLRGCETCLKTT
jgi:RNA polymerase sigma-70 factor (ECF subfamily)